MSSSIANAFRSPSLVAVLTFTLFVHFFSSFSSSFSLAPSFLTFARADEQGNPEVEKDAREQPHWNDFRETFVPLHEDFVNAKQNNNNNNLAKDYDEDGDVPWIEHVSWEPRVYVYHNFLSEREAIHLRKRYHEKMKNNVKTMGVSIKRGKDEVVNKIEERLSAFVMLPETHGEDMFVTKTAKGYAQRLEILDEKKDAAKMANGGQRFATTALFLNTLTEGKGGELVFPMATERLFGGSDSSISFGKRRDSATGSLLSECAKKHKVVVAPRAGNAVLWFGSHHNGYEDMKSASLRCDATKSGEEMFTAYKNWRVGRYNQGNFLQEEKSSEEETSYVSSSEF